MPLPNESFQLSEATRSFLEQMIGLAVEKYRASAAYMRTEASAYENSALALQGSTAHFDIRCMVEARCAAASIGRLANQFDAQVLEATELQTRLQAADSVTVGAVVPCVEPGCSLPACHTGPCVVAEEEEEGDEPDEDAITTKDHLRFYQYGKVAFEYMPDGKVVVIFATREKPSEEFPAVATVEAAIRRYCDETQFWPDAWFISDHGNAHRIDLGPVQDVKA